MDLAVVVLLQVVASVASLALISVGLAVIFGMMRVINLAHGELIMLGGYAVIYATRWGVNLWIAMLIVAPLFVGVIGMIVERTVIRFLYGRMIDTMLATWGLSLLLIGAATMIFGNTTTGVSAPLGGVTIGQYQTSQYELVLVVDRRSRAAGSHGGAEVHQGGSHRTRHHAEPGDGRIAWHQHQYRVLGHFRRGSGAERDGRRTDRTAFRRTADDGNLVRREGIHHRDQRRRGDHLGHALREHAARIAQHAGHVRRHACHR